MAARETILQKIRSLLALATDQKGKPEGTLAGQMAQKMIQKYAVSYDELSSRQTPLRHAQQDYYDDYADEPIFEPFADEQPTWTESNQYIYQQIRSIIDQDSTICTAVGHQCGACFWLHIDRYGFPNCGFFDNYLEAEV